MEEFLNRFKRHIDLMEQEFDQTLHDSRNMNNMLVTYEESLISNYGDGYKKSKVTNPCFIQRCARSSTGASCECYRANIS